MSQSIQSRLTLALTAAAMVLSAAMGVMLYHLIAAEMERNFDRGLESEGKAVVSLVSLEAGGVLDFEFNSAAMPQYHAGRGSDFFQIRYADGRPYARSESLGQEDLRFQSNRADGAAAFFDLALPDGRPGRAVQIQFIPQSETSSDKAAEPMVAVIGRERAGLDESQRNLGRILIGACVMLGAVTATISRWIVRRSLAPLRQVATEAASIDAQRLDQRLTRARMPAELTPICDRLNDLLSRIETAFLRERRFTSDVAHELRTPIAELRAVTEVALTWPYDAEVAQEALRDALDIATQMETLVNTLLSLIRSGGGAPPPLSQIELAPSVQHLAAKLSTGNRANELIVSIPPTAVVWAEPALLNSILSNLLSNAFEYASGRTIECRAHQESGRWSLTIQNGVSQLAPEDVKHVFEPFWRKDGSRSGGNHAGLGLALVKAYCAVMRAHVSASLSADHLFQIKVTFAAGDLTEDLHSAAPSAEQLRV